MNIIPSINSNAIKYAKKLLDKHQGSMLNEVRTRSFTLEAFDFNVSASSSLIHVELELKEPSNASIQVLDIYGNTVNSGINKSFASGKQAISLPIPSAGIYVVNVTVNNDTVSKKVSAR